MKKYLILLIVVFLTGCTCDYEITFNKNSIDEEITSIIYPEDQIPQNEIGDDDYIDYLLHTNLYPLTNTNQVVYDRTIEDDDNNQKVTLKYSYNPADFEKYSYILNTCFDNHEFVNNGGHYYIHLTGNFYCLYNDELNITVKSSNHIKKCNGQKEDGNCKWTINSSNMNNVDIEIEISAISKTRRLVMFFIAGIILFVFAIFIAYFIIKINNRNSINDI